MGVSAHDIAAVWSETNDDDNGGLFPANEGFDSRMHDTVHGRVRKHKDI